MRYINVVQEEHATRTMIMMQGRGCCGRERYHQPAMTLIQLSRFNPVWQSKLARLYAVNYD